VPTPFAHQPESDTGPWFFCLRHPAHAGVVHILMVGELDLAAADYARDVIRRAQIEAAHVICDLSDVSFIDPRGLRVLIDAAARARRHDARLNLANISPRVLRLMALDALLEEDALPSAAPLARLPIAARPPVALGSRVSHARPRRRSRRPRRS
jgi:anti-anti-sigma factor